MFLIPVDRDKTNCDPRNWDLVTWSVVRAMRSLNKVIGDHEELRPTVVAVAKMKAKIGEMRKGRSYRSTPDD